MPGDSFPTRADSPYPSRAEKGRFTHSMIPARTWKMPSGVAERMVASCSFWILSLAFRLLPEHGLLDHGDHLEELRPDVPGLREREFRCIVHLFERESGSAPRRPRRMTGVVFPRVLRYFRNSIPFISGDEFDPVHVRHLLVRDDDVECPAFQFLGCLLDRMGRLDPDLPGLFKKRADLCEKFGIVIDE